MIGHFALTLTRFKEKCMLKKYAFSNRYQTSVSGLWEPITGSFTIACFANTYCQYGKHILLIFISSWTYCCILNVTAQFITRQLKWPWKKLQHMQIRDHCLVYIRSLEGETKEMSTTSSYLLHSLHIFG